jgi:protein-S-isoprenylcysteine O-methyltransferase Ste14
MSSLEAMSAWVLAFSFTHHSYFIGITNQMLLKCSSLSFSTTSSLGFCALIFYILLLLLGVSPGGHK